MYIRKLSLLDFGMGILSGLHLRGVTTLDERELVKLHESFAEAFWVVEKLMGEEKLKFSIILHQIHRTSGGVDAILNYWLSVWVTKDSPGTILRFRLTDYTASRYLSRLPGGEEVFLPAADAFLKRYQRC